MSSGDQTIDELRAEILERHVRDHGWAGVSKLLEECRFNDERRAAEVAANRVKAYVAAAWPDKR